MIPRMVSAPPRILFLAIALAISCIPFRTDPRSGPIHPLPPMVGTPEPNGTVSDGGPGPDHGVDPGGAATATGTIAPPPVVEPIALTDLTGMVRIPEGPFTRGGADVPQATPVSEVYLSTYWIDVDEVSCATYDRFLAWNETRPHAACHPDEPPGKDHTPGHANDPRYSGADLPRVGVDWFDAYAACRALGKRLPTEAEWEKAARGTDGRAWPWGPERVPEAYNHGAPVSPWMDASDGHRYTAPVGRDTADRSPYGVRDLGGNVREWVADWYAANAWSRGPSKDPSGPAGGTMRACRGDGWYYYEALGTADARTRSAYLPLARSFALGFRCAANGGGPE